MNTSVDNTVSPNTDNRDVVELRPQIREALDRIALVAANDPSAVIGDNYIEIGNCGHRTKISVRPVNLQAVDGFWIGERFDIRTPTELFQHYSEEALSWINFQATTGAIVRDENGQDAVVSTLPVFEADDQALADLYTPLIANAAILQMVGPWSAAYRLADRMDEYGPAEAGIAGWDAPSLWTEWEFENASHWLRMNGVYTNHGAQGLAAEFAWDLGAISATGGKRTSLLTLSTNELHPSAGNGLSYHLRLPIVLDDNDAQRLATDLNRFEINAVDSAPFIGAWCARRGGEVAFTGFWPNAIYHKGTAANIACWCMVRSHMARQVIGNWLAGTGTVVGNADDDEGCCSTERVSVLDAAGAPKGVKQP